MLLATPPPAAHRPGLPISDHFQKLLLQRIGQATGGRPPQSSGPPTNVTGVNRDRRPAAEGSVHGVPVVQLQLPQFVAGLHGARPVPPHLAPPPPRLPLGPQAPGPRPPLPPLPPHGQLGSLLRRPRPTVTTPHPVLRLTGPSRGPYRPAPTQTAPTDYGDYDDIITAAAPLPDLNGLGLAPTETTTEKDLETLGAIVSTIINRRNRTEQAALDRNMIRKRLGLAAVDGGGGGQAVNQHEHAVGGGEAIHTEQHPSQPAGPAPASSQRPALSAVDRRRPPLSHSVTRPPVTRPPVTRPPMTRPPVTRPSVTRPPVTRPPVTRPPLTRPPVTRLPLTRHPVTRHPVTRPSMTRSPPTRHLSDWSSTRRAPTTATVSMWQPPSTHSGTEEDVALFTVVPTQGPALDRANAVPGLELPANSTGDAAPPSAGRLSSEEIAYILIGTTAGLSVFCLVIVAVTMKCRRQCSVYALLSRLVHSEYIQGLGSRMSSARSHRSAAGAAADAPTHKLGSWFNGRTESLGGAEKFRSNMALPVGYSSNISSLGVKPSKPHGYSVRRLDSSTGALISSASSSSSGGGGSVADTSDQEETMGGRRGDSGSEGGRAASRGTSWLHGSYVFGGGETQPPPGAGDGPVHGVLYRRSSDELPPPAAAELRRSRRASSSGQQAALPARRRSGSRQGSRRDSGRDSKMTPRRQQDAEGGRHRSPQQRRSQSRANSPDQRFRHRSQSRANSPDHRLRHRSQSRTRSPERQGRRRSQSRARSPDHRLRHRSQSRARSPDHHARRRSQSRARSAERPSRRSASRGRSPPAAARRSPSEPRQQRRRPRDSSRPRDVSEQRASLRHVRPLADAASEGSNSAVNWSSSDERLI